jgi:hypothetical protein
MGEPGSLKENGVSNKHRRVNQTRKCETRNPNEIPSPKPEIGASSPLLGFWFWAFIRISGFGFQAYSPLHR